MDSNLSLRVYRNFGLFYYPRGYGSHGKGNMLLALEIIIHKDNQKVTTSVGGIP